MKWPTIVLLILAGIAGIAVVYYFFGRTKQRAAVLGGEAFLPSTTYDPDGVLGLNFSHL